MNYLQAGALTKPRFVNDGRGSQLRTLYVLCNERTRGYIRYREASRECDKESHQERDNKQTKEIVPTADICQM